MSSSNKKQNPKPQSRFMRITSIFILCSIALLTIAGLWAYWQYKTVPKYWVDNQQYLSDTDNQTLYRIASDLEKHLNSKITEPQTQPDQSSRRLRIPTSLINAWLNQRLTLWAADFYGIELPENISDVMLSTEADNLVLAFEINDGNINQVISTIFNITFNNSDTATLKLVGLRAGSLSLPVSASLSQLGEIDNLTGPDTPVEITQLDKGLTFNPTFPIDKSRNAQIIGLKTEPATPDHPEAIVIQFKHTPRPSNSSSRHASSASTLSAS
ncbi:hypothetical protein JD969_02700 [Planctomycetota bacterium]|nr:hypothetical protein JD969_02700 [Planctomycetota bacterium]